MYVYEAGCIDWWHGMTRLVDFINLCPSVIDNDLCEDDSFYPSHNKLKSFLRRAFIHVSMRDIYWEGDIRDDDCIGISAIYSSYNNHPNKILVFKQDTNGSSFIVSENILYVNSDIKLIDEKDITDQYDINGLICEFNIVDNLIEDIFSRALNKPKIEEKNNLLEVAKECISRDELKKEGFEGIKLSEFN